MLEGNHGQCLRRRHLPTTLTSEVVSTYLRLFSNVAFVFNFALILDIFLTDSDRSPIQTLGCGPLLLFEIKG